MSWIDWSNFWTSLLILALTMLPLIALSADSAIYLPPAGLSEISPNQSYTLPVTLAKKEMTFDGDSQPSAPPILVYSKELKTCEKLLQVCKSQLKDKELIIELLTKRLNEK